MATAIGGDGAAIRLATLNSLLNRDLVTVDRSASLISGQRLALAADSDASASSRSLRLLG
jgi:hypothetical protein